MKVKNGLSSTSLTLAIIVSFIGLTIICIYYQHLKPDFDIKVSKNLTFIEQSAKEFEEDLNELLEERPKEPKIRTTERTIFKDEFLTITDCGSEEVYVERLSFGPLPLNVKNKWVFDTKMIFSGGLYSTTDLHVEVDKWLFGLSWLPINIPCFMGFFGSCGFNLCEMFRLHWDEQFCEFMSSRYNMSCQCPQILTKGILEINHLKYTPHVDRINKYLSWFATGWYNVVFKLVHNKSQKVFLCTRTNFYIKFSK